MGQDPLCRWLHLCAVHCLLFAVSVLAVGCARSKHAAPASGVADASYGVEGGAAMEEMAEMEMDDAAASPDRHAFRGRKAATAEMAAPPPAPSSAPPTQSMEEPTADGAEPRPADPAVAQPQPNGHGRQIVYTATMRVAVFDQAEAMAKAESLPERFGGWLHVRQGSRMVLKIPAASLPAAMDEIGEMGNVEDRQLRAQDVTAQFVDLESRIRVLQQTRDRLLDLLQKAHTAKEALEVQRALDDVTMRLEQALGQMRVMRDAISFSTLTVDFAERGPHTPVPTSNDPFPWVDGLGVEATQWR